jgi:hypothetical protein
MKLEKLLLKYLEKIFGKIEDQVNYLGGKKEKE